MVGLQRPATVAAFGKAGAIIPGSNLNSTGVKESYVNQKCVNYGYLLRKRSTPRQKDEEMGMADALTNQERDKELNQQLQGLLQEAQDHPLGSLQRRRMLSRLIQAIQRSGQLAHPQRGQWSPNQYEDLYNQALSKTFEYIAKNIDAYNPRYPVMAWVNDILKKRFIDVVRSEMRHLQPYSYDALVESGYQQAAEAPEASDLAQLKDCLQSYPCFAQTHIQKRPEVTFQQIFLLRLDGYQWEDLATQLDLRPSTLSTFFYRNLQKFKPDILAYLQTD